MTVAPAKTEKRQAKLWQAKSGLIWFVVLAYVFAWAWSLPVAFAGSTVEQGSGWPTHIPSLVAPLLAALVVVGFAEGRAGLGDLVRRMGRWRFGPVLWLAVVSPLAILGLTVAGMALAGENLPPLSDFARFGGLPAYGVAQTLLLVFVLNGLGEETGWRGFLQDRLQTRIDPLSATLFVALVWAVWHTPFFFILSTYSGFTAITLVMFPLGLASGAIVLTWLYNRTGRSILAVGLWHTLYNMAVATAGSTDLIQGVVTAAVILAAATLVTADLIARRRGKRPVLGSAR
jgi:membrane protease YdiL (CAAX protease family)